MKRRWLVCFIPAFVIVFLLLLRMGCGNPSPQGFLFASSENIQCVEAENSSYDLISLSEKIGGVVPFDIPTEAMLINPVAHADEILSILQDKGFQEANNPSFDRMVSGSTKADVQVWFGNAEEERMHYIFFSGTQALDLWIDRKKADREMEKAILQAFTLDPKPE